MIIAEVHAPALARPAAPRPSNVPVSLEQPSAMQQFYPNSCGAVSLLCVAKELGVKSLPAYEGSQSQRFGDNSLKLDRRCEMDIYRITSGSCTQRQMQHDMTKAGYSMPDGIVTAGRMLGLHMALEEDPGCFSKTLNWLYPDTRQKMSLMGCAVETGSRQIENNQAKIEALTVSMLGVPVGLHWVVQRQDGSYMNPDTGKNYTNFDALNAGAKREVNCGLGYYKTGICVIVTGPESSAR